MPRTNSLHELVDAHERLGQLMNEIAFGDAPARDLARAAAKEMRTIRLHRIDRRRSTYLHALAA